MTKLLSLAESSFSLNQTSPNNITSLSSANLGTNSPSTSLPAVTLFLIFSFILYYEKIKLKNLTNLEISIRYCSLLIIMNNYLNEEITEENNYYQ